MSQVTGAKAASTTNERCSNCSIGQERCLVGRKEGEVKYRRRIPIKDMIIVYEVREMFSVD